MNIGLTGGIACGKSTVAEMLEKRGAIIIDADVIAREVVGPGKPALKQLVQHFGSEVLLPDGTLNRKKLGSIVFSDENKRKELNSILHPAIRAEMFSRMEHYEHAQPDKLVVVDVPLLYESGLSPMFEKVMVVYVPSEVQLERLMNRDGLNRLEAENRIRAQMPIEEKKRLADIVIDNSGSQEKTEAQIEQFWKGKFKQ